MVIIILKSISEELLPSQLIMPMQVQLLFFFKYGKDKIQQRLETRSLIFQD